MNEPSIKAQRGMVAMLNDRGVRGARIEHRPHRQGEQRAGWYINDVFAGANAREARTAIRVNAQRFAPPEQRN